MTQGQLIPPLGGPTARQERTPHESRTWELARDPDQTREETATSLAISPGTCKILYIDKGTPAYKRLIRSHHKHLNRGDFRVDDRPDPNGVDKFGGEVIPLGTPEFPACPAVVNYLRARA